MDNAVKVSVIMPVYKVEKFVGKAIESMLSQTLSDFEFLIVDDGTPDNSGKICDEYAQKDSRIRVFHRENGGAPSARNMAMEEARGSITTSWIPTTGQSPPCCRIWLSWRKSTRPSWW